MVQSTRFFVGEILGDAMRDRNGRKLPLVNCLGILRSLASRIRLDP